MTEALCTLKAVSFDYPGKKGILSRISLALYPGECLAILGGSGSGKSTLGALFSGQLNPSSGTLTWKGGFFQTPKTLQSFRKLQRVFQDPSSALTAFYTPYTTLNEVLKLHFPLTIEERETRIVTLLKEVGLSPLLAHQKIKTLSGGEKQRLVLARALAVDPEILILDEPTSSCDLSLQASLLLKFKALVKEKKMTLVIILHSLSQARYLADRICILKEGKIEELSSTEDLFTRPQTEYTQKLLLTADPNLSFSPVS